MGGWFWELFQRSLKFTIRVDLPKIKKIKFSHSSLCLAWQVEFYRVSWQFRAIDFIHSYGATLYVQCFTKNVEQLRNICYYYYHIFKKNTSNCYNIYNLLTHSKLVDSLYSWRKLEIVDRNCKWWLPMLKQTYKKIKLSAFKLFQVFWM